MSPPPRRRAGAVYLSQWARATAEPAEPPTLELVRPYVLADHRAPPPAAPVELAAVARVGARGEVRRAAVL
ncbi:MAG: hypothetical protein GEU94_14825 [Micromonosporaceae bacterium]|nr:hypothetical protein [Micromonosporaceae bacterium]